MIAGIAGSAFRRPQSRIEPFAFRRRSFSRQRKKVPFDVANFHRATAEADAPRFPTQQAFSVEPSHTLAGRRVPRSDRRTSGYLFGRRLFPVCPIPSPAIAACHFSAFS